MVGQDDGEAGPRAALEGAGAPGPSFLLTACAAAATPHPCSCSIEELNQQQALADASAGGQRKKLAGHCGRCWLPRQAQQEPYCVTGLLG